MGACCVKAVVAEMDEADEHSPLLNQADDNDTMEQGEGYQPPLINQSNNGSEVQIKDLNEGESIEGVIAAEQEEEFSQDELKLYLKNGFQFESTGEDEVDQELMRPIGDFNNVLAQLKEFRESCDKIRKYQPSGLRTTTPVSMKSAMNNFALELQDYDLNLRVKRYDDGALKIFYNESNIRVDKVKEHMKTISNTFLDFNGLKGKRYNPVQRAENILAKTSGEQGLERKVLNCRKCTTEGRKNYHTMMKFIRCIPTRLWPMLHEQVEAESAEFLNSFMESDLAGLE